MGMKKERGSGRLGLSETRSICAKDRIRNRTPAPSIQGFIRGWTILESSSFWASQEMKKARMRKIALRATLLAERSRTLVMTPPARDMR